MDLGDVLSWDTSSGLVRWRDQLPKLETALASLALSEEPPLARLARAIQESGILTWWPSNTEGLPQAVRDDIGWLHVMAFAHGDISELLHLFDDRQRERAARTLLRLYGAASAALLDHDAKLASA